MENTSIIELKENELINVEGGSELTDAIWYGIGATLGWLYEGVKGGNKSLSMSPSGIQH